MHGHVKNMWSSYQSCTVSGVIAQNVHRWWKVVRCVVSAECLCSFSMQSQHGSLPLTQYHWNSPHSGFHHIISFCVHSVHFIHTVPAHYLLFFCGYYGMLFDRDSVDRQERRGKSEEEWPACNKGLWLKTNQIRWDRVTCLVFSFTCAHISL